MNEKQNNNDIAIATIRLAAIQPAFNGTFPDVSKQVSATGMYYSRSNNNPIR